MKSQSPLPHPPKAATRHSNIASILGPPGDDVSVCTSYKSLYILSCSFFLPWVSPYFYHYYC